MTTEQDANVLNKGDSSQLLNFQQTFYMIWIVRQKEVRHANVSVPAVTVLMVPFGNQRPQDLSWKKNVNLIEKKITKFYYEY